MMFSTEKCSGHSRSGSPDEAEIFAGGGEGLGKDGVASDEVASAVAAVSDDIGDILKDELGDADRADRIGAELADLSAELGILAGLDDGQPQAHFPSLFEIAIGHRGSGSVSSSSSSTSSSGVHRARRPPRPLRTGRRKPITKQAKEASRRRSALGRRVVSLRLPRLELVSDASDVPASCDSDDQWTELDDALSSEDSSVKNASTAAEVDSSEYQDKPQDAEAPPMGQFLLPLLSADTGAAPAQFLIRHEDILQLLASAEAQAEMPGGDEDNYGAQDDIMQNELFPCDQPSPVSPEDEAALLNYVCDAPEDSCDWQAVDEWLMGVHHSRSEVSVFIYTMSVCAAILGIEMEQWVYRCRFPCHCALCLCACASRAAVRSLYERVRRALHEGDDTTVDSAWLTRSLGTELDVASWDPARRPPVSDAGATVIHEQLLAEAQKSELANKIICRICECRPYDKPMEKQYAVERFFKILENYKAVSTGTFKVEMLKTDGERDFRLEKLLSRYLTAYQQGTTSERLRQTRLRTTPQEVNAWAGYKHKCECLTPRTLCAQQRKELLRLSFLQVVNELHRKTEPSEGDKATNDAQAESPCRELQQGDGTGAKPPDACLNALTEREDSGREMSDSNITQDLDDDDDDDDDEDDDDDDDDDEESSLDSEHNSLGGSLGLSTSSSLDSASELLLAAAAAVESGGSDGSAGGGSLCVTVRHLMRSIASIERLMDRVLRQCAQYAHKQTNNRKRVDMGLTEVDRKLMAMYRRLPDVHRKQLQVYRKQKKLSTVCMQLVGGSAPAPPAPGSPPSSPPPSPPPRRARPIDYHLHRFKEVRRKVMHMRDQQLYYHRLRMWLEEQLRQERDSAPENNVSLVEEIPRRKRRTASPKVPRLSASKRKLKPSASVSKPHKILQMLKHKAPAHAYLDDFSTEVDPPEAFPLEKDDISDADTIVGEKEADLCKEMKDCLAKFANFALNEDKYPDSVSPPLQEMSPTSEAVPVYTPKPSQRLLTVNKLLRNNPEFQSEVEFQSPMMPDVLNIAPLNARRTPMLVEEVTEDKAIDLQLPEVLEGTDVVVDGGKDPNLYKYVTFGLEIKKAMEECQNIINSYNSVKEKHAEANKIDDKDGPLSLEQICEVMLNLDKSSAEFLLEKIETDDPMDINTANTKLAELVENMPHILANMPEIASKLWSKEFANASFELPEFASIMNSLPDVNSEAQLTPETLKQIRELKLNKNRDSVKVTKNTTKRKSNRKVKNNIDNNNIMGTMTFEFDCKDISELLKDEKELQALMKNKSSNKEDFKDLLFSISAQVVINKVFEYLKQNKNPVLAKCLEDDKDLFSLPKNSINSEMFSKASTLFDNSVKDALSMDDLRELVKSRFNSWKHYVASKFKSIPMELLENEIEAMLDKFYSYIQDLAKECECEADKAAEKIAEIQLKAIEESVEEICPASKESLKTISKILNTTAGNTFDIIIMKLSEMSVETQSSIKSLKLKYMDMIKRCAESQQLAAWIIINPEVAANVISDMTNLPPRPKTEALDPAKVSSMTNEKKREYFLERLKEMNMLYMETLPKASLTGDEWLVMLYRLEDTENKLKDMLSKICAAKVMPHTEVSEARASEFLERTIIGKELIKIVANTKTKPISKSLDRNVQTKQEKERADETKRRSDAVLAKCEAILKAKGDITVLDNFYTIKRYISQGLPVPEGYKRHVISICSSIDSKLFDDVLEDSTQKKPAKEECTDKKHKCCQEFEDDSGNSSPNCCGKDKNPAAVIGSPELLAKYSAQALRKAKQTLNAVAFRKNILRNGQTKSESDACDTPKTDCKWTNDCVCDTCKSTDASGVCLGDIVKQCYDMEAKSKSTLEEKKKEVKVAAKPAVKPAKPPPKPCENASHQQHVCKVGHTSGACSSDGAGVEQPCTCCYCTVFGHAPPITTPVPRNFNETRERLRSILNRKKQKCKPTTNGEPESQDKKATAPAEAPPQPTPKLKPTPVPCTPKPPPVLPKPAVPAQQPTQAPPAPAPAEADQQHQLAERMARIHVDDSKVKPLQRPMPAQTSAPPTAADGKVNAQAMEQIRLQQLKQQQFLQAQAHALQQVKKQQPSKEQGQTMSRQEMVVKQLEARSRQQQAQRSRDPSTDTSSSEGSDSCWRGCREDPRDLDALLQYIEGPARHVDRGKKRAKKQRQKAKKLEMQLLSEAASLRSQYQSLKALVERLRAVHNSHSRRMQDLTARLQKRGKNKKKSAQNKQIVVEEYDELVQIVNETSKELTEAEKRVQQVSARLDECERNLLKIREPTREEKMQRMQDFQRQRVLELQRQRQTMTQQPTATVTNMSQMQSRPAIDPNRYAQMNMNRPPTNDYRTAQPVRQEEPPKPQPEEKKPVASSWEQALAHMNHLVQTANKEKKKQKEQAKAAKAEAAKQKEQPAPEPAPLTKKQRRALAKQQAEEEEAKRKQQEAKANKKSEQKKQDTAKSEPAKKEGKKEMAAAKKDEKKDNKKVEKSEAKKGKENKQEKNNAQPQPTTKQQKQQSQQQQQNNKKKKEPQQPQQPRAQVINITADTTLEAVKKGARNAEPEKVPSCSIMEQLSCGVQVADLKLPPGITLTRVQPNEKREAPTIKSVPIWKCNQLAAAPTPVARPPPVINADPAMMMFSTAPALGMPEPPKTIIVPDLPPAPAPAPAPAGKSKKAKKKAKKAAAAADNTPIITESKKQDGTKMVTLRNPMFHPNMPPVQVGPQQPNNKDASLRIPDPIPMPPNAACQATITPTSNGMYTIRNPLMSMMHQQSLGMRPQSPQVPNMYPQQNYNYVNPNVYNPPIPPQAYVIDASRTSPKNIEVKTDYQNQTRLMNLASFTQKNDEGYSLFKTNDDNQSRGFLNPESYYLDSNFTNQAPKPTVSPNPIGTRPTSESNRSFDSNDSSLFTNNSVQRPEPIGTPLKRTEEERSDFIGGLYTPFGQEDRNVFRNALFDKGDIGSGLGQDMNHHMSNGDSLPYFQRLRVGSKLNSEVTIHHVTESKFYKGQEPQMPLDVQSNKCEETLFSYPNKSWAPGYVAPSPPVGNCTGDSLQCGAAAEAACEGGAHDEEIGFGAVGSRAARPPLDQQSMYTGERPDDRASLEALQRYEQLYLQSHRMHHLNTN